MTQKYQLVFGLSVLSTVFAAACSTPNPGDGGDTGMDETAAVDVPNRADTPRDVPNRDVPNGADIPNPIIEDPTVIDVPDVDVQVVVDDTGDVVVPPIDNPAVIDVPNVDVPNGADVPNFDVPNFDVPNRDVPPGVDVPNFDVPTDVPCPANTRVFGGRCVGIGTARPVAPLSLSDSTLRRPTFRWAFPVGFDGATIEICRDRACSMIIETATVVGTSVRPVMTLPASSTIYWRVRGRVGAVEDPTNSATWLFHTPAVDASAGIDTSMNPRVDFNGDGIDDVVLGTPLADVGGMTDVGTVTIIMGAMAGLPAMPTRVINGAAAQDSFGYAVASAGDLNGDGYGDLIIGARQASSAGVVRSGTATIYHGSATGLRAMPTIVLAGEAMGDAFGYSVATAGDVNGDGYAEVIVGALNASPGGVRAAGTVGVYNGSINGVGSTPTTLLVGNGAADGFGYSISSGGDLNGDGLSEVVIGARLSSPGGRVNAGTVSVHYGNRAGLPAIAQVVLEGAAAADYMGNSVASAGDVNGDGYGDLLVASFNASPPGLARAGITSIYHGSVGGITRVPDRTLSGVGVGDALGDSVASAGDINNDGFGDIVVGAYAADPGGVSNAGTVGVYHGSVAGIAAAPTRLLVGAAVNTLAGYCVSGAGDVNGDGFDDIIVGGAGASPGGRVAAGTASVHLGTAMGITVAPAVVYEGALALDNMGHSVAQLGSNPARPQRGLRSARGRENALAVQTVQIVRTRSASGRTRG